MIRAHTEEATVEGEMCDLQAVACKGLALCPLGGAFRLLGLLLPAYPPQLVNGIEHNKASAFMEADRLDEQLQRLVNYRDERLQDTHNYESAVELNRDVGERFACEVGISERLVRRDRMATLATCLVALCLAVVRWRWLGF